MNEMKPWSYYAAAGKREALAGRVRRMLGAFLIAVIFCLWYGGKGALLLFDDPATRWQLIFGSVVVGLIAGFIAGMVGEKKRAIRCAEVLYAYDWASIHGYGYYEFADPWFGAPYSTSGESQEALDEFLCEIDGLSVMSYNASYTLESGWFDHRPNEKVKKFQVMTISGPPLPLGRMSLLNPGEAKTLEWNSELRGYFAPESPVSLESAAFNEMFELRIDSTADEVPIRQIFTPAVIDRLVQSTTVTPGFFYAHDVWWTITPGHFSLRKLDEVVAKQRIAVAAIRSIANTRNELPSAEQVGAGHSNV